MKSQIRKTFTMLDKINGTIIQALQTIPLRGDKNLIGVDVGTVFIEKDRKLTRS